MKPSREVSCTGKQRYRSPSRARSAVRYLRQRGEVVHVYPCRYCHGWHVGH